MDFYPLRIKQENSYLRLRGFPCAIDDFGTGTSSLQRLARIPFSQLKIDQSCIRQARSSLLARKILQHTINLAQDLNLSVVAEGIETEEDFDRIAQLGCNIAQGFYFAPPMPLNQFLAYTAQLQGNKYLLRGKSMKTKEFRILIADPSLKHQIHIERNLNQLGYHRIITATTREETLKLTRVHSCQIDVLIISEELSASIPHLKPYDSNGSSLNARCILRYPRVESSTKDTSRLSKRTSAIDDIPSSISLYLFMQSAELMNINNLAEINKYTEVNFQLPPITNRE